jgi:hypothetical protein
MPNQVSPERFLNMSSVAEKKPAEAVGKPKFFLDIEGVIYPWPVSTITTEQIAELGGWEPEVGVIQIDKDNNERTLEPGEVVELKPGMGFAKKIKWRRG